MANKPQHRSGWGGVEKLPSGRYRARYPHPFKTGERISPPGRRTFRNKSAARAWLEGERRLLDLDAWTPPEERARKEKADQRTVRDLMAAYLDSLPALKPSTRAKYEQDINNRLLEPIATTADTTAITQFAGMRLSAVERRDARSWWDAVRAAYPDTAATNARVYQRVKAAFAVAVDREWIAANPIDVPAAERRYKAREKYLPRYDELVAVIDTIEPRYRALAVLTLICGLRIGEAIALERAHVTIEDGGTVRVSVEQNAQYVSGRGWVFLDPKTPSGKRRVPVLEKWSWVFAEHVEHYAPATPVEVDDARAGTREALLFSGSPRGGLVADKVLRAAISRAVKRAGVDERIKPHNGRNWIVTALLRRDATPQEVGKIIGDTDLSTVMRVYAKVEDGRVDEAITELDAGL